jgi:hypothetical protein
MKKAIPRDHAWLKMAQTAPMKFWSMSSLEIHRLRQV